MSSKPKIDSAEPKFDDTNGISKLEKFLRRNKATLTIPSLLIGILAFSFTLFQFAHAKNQAELDRHAKEIADLKIEIKEEESRRIAEVKSARAEAQIEEERKYKLQELKLTKEHRSIVNKLGTSNNVMRILEMVSDFSKDLKGKKLDTAEGQPDQYEINFPAFQRMISLSNALMDAPTFEGKTPTPPNQFRDVARHVCRYLFAKCRDEDTSIAATSLAVVGHIINDRDMYSVATSQQENGDLIDKDFIDDLEGAVSEGIYSSVSFKNLKPNFSKFCLDGAKFTDAKFPLGVQLDSSSIRRTDFSRTNFVSSSFKNANLENDDLSINDKTIFVGAEFNECQNFEGANLSYADFSNTIWKKCIVGGNEVTNLQHAQLNGISVEGGLQFLKVKLDHVAFSLLEGSMDPIIDILSDSTLDDAVFKFPIIKTNPGSKFEAPLLRLNVSSAKRYQLISDSPIRVEARQSVLDDIDLSNANVLGAQFLDCNIERGSFGPNSLTLTEKFRPRFEGKTNLTGADLSRCPNVEADWFDNTYFHWTRVPEGSGLAKALAEAVGKTAGEGPANLNLNTTKDSWVVITKPLDPTATSADTERELTRYFFISKEKDGVWSVNSAAEQLTTDLLKYLQSNGMDGFRTLGIIPHKDTDGDLAKLEGTNHTIILDDPKSGPREKVEYLKNLTPADVRLSLLSSPNWKLRLTPKPEAKVE